MWVYFILDSFQAHVSNNLSLLRCRKQIFLIKPISFPRKPDLKIVFCYISQLIFFSKLLIFHQFWLKNHKINICEDGHKYTSHFGVLKNFSIFGPFLGPFGGPIQIFEKFSLSLQSSNYQYKSALELLLQFKTLPMGVIYTLHFFQVQRIKREKGGFRTLFYILISRCLHLIQDVHLVSF